jgi:hypothetical protein
MQPVVKVGWLAVDSLGPWLGVTSDGGAVVKVVVMMMQERWQ